MCGGMPVQLPAAGQQRLAQRGIAAAVADVPLPGGDDLQRLLALLVELHRVHAPARARRAVPRRRAAARRSAPGPPARSARPAAGRRPGRPGAVQPGGGPASSRPSWPITGRVSSRRSRHQVTSVVSPNVQTMAMPVPLAGSASRCARTGTAHPEQRRAAPWRRTAPAYRSSSGMRDQRHAGGQQLGPGGGHRARGVAVRRARNAIRYVGARPPPGPRARPGPPRSRTSRPTATGASAR